MSNIYFYDGKLVRVVADVPSDILHVIVEVNANYKKLNETMNYQLYVRRSDLEVPVAVAFPLNTRVKTKSNCPLHGHVVGYEYEMNRVIVISDKINKYANDRTRYSYGIKDVIEIPPPPKVFTFEKAKFYKINGNTDVYAVRQLDDLITLVDKKGRVRHTDLAPVSDIAGLRMTEGIDSVKEIKGWM